MKGRDIMQIVIDIPEEDYKWIKRDDALDYGVLWRLNSAIRSRILLPKGHEDLIERNKLLEKIWDVDCRCGYVQVVDRQDIEDAPTIIEADKKEEE